MSRKVAKYLTVMVVTARSGLAYPFDTFARAGFMAVVIFVFIQLWSAAFQLTGQGSVAGYDLPRMIWYLVLTETIIMSCPRVSSEVDQQVKAGDLAYALNRPYNFGLFHYAQYMGKAALTLPLNFLVGGALALVFAGAPVVPGYAWPAIGLAAILAMTLNFVVEFSIGLLGFWFEDTFAFFWIYQKIVFTFGGLFLPLELFPEPLRQIAAVLPFTSISYGPGRLAATFALSRFIETLGTQVFWLIAVGLLAMLLYRRGVRRINVNGG